MPGVDALPADQHIECVRAELAQLRREYGNRPAFDRVDQSIAELERLLARLVAVVRVVGDAADSTGVWSP